MASSSDRATLGPTHSVVLYDPGTGHVRHIHHQLTLSGAPAPDKAVLEREAREVASRHHPDLAKLLALHTDSLNPTARYQVDVARRVLVERPPAHTIKRSPSVPLGPPKIAT
jgi:hypothetical protein